MVTGFTTNRSDGGEMYQLSNQNPSSQKSDIWLEDLVIEKIEATVAGACPEKSLTTRLKRNAEKSTAKYGASCSRNCRADKFQAEKRSGSVRFEVCTETGGNSCSDDSKMLLKPDPNTNSRQSPSVKSTSTYSSIGMEESTVETIGEF